MDLQKISAGKNPPSEINVVIEIPANTGPVKYEVDKDSGALFVDRLMATPMYYPCNYGFVPNTLSDDGDPIDVLVITPVPLVAGCVIPSRPIAVLKMSDEAGVDSKIIAVPTAKMTTAYNHVSEASDLPEGMMENIGHFFEHYKDLEKGKWVKVDGWGTADEARKDIEAAVAAYK